MLMYQNILHTIAKNVSGLYEGKELEVQMFKFSTMFNSSINVQ